jgi:hypothetical protein
MPECSIRVWYADMPVPLSLSNGARQQESLYMRIRWSRSGLIKRIKMATMQHTPKIFLTKQVCVTCHWCTTIRIAALYVAVVSVLAL